MWKYSKWEDKTDNTDIDAQSGDSEAVLMTAEIAAKVGIYFLRIFWEATVC